MLNSIGQIIIAVFAVIAVYEIVIQLYKFFFRQTKHIIYKAEIRMFLKKNTYENAEVAIRSVLSETDSGVLKNADIIIESEGLDEETKEVCKKLGKDFLRVKME